MKYLILYVLLLPLCQAEVCNEAACGRKLLDDLFFGADPALLTDGPHGMARTFRKACSSYAEFFECERAASPTGAQTPLAATCVPVHDAVCKVAEVLERTAERDFCVTAVSKQAEYQVCLFDALAAFHTFADSGDDRFCEIPVPYLSFESCRLLALSNAGCDAAVFYLQQYVEALVPFTQEACKLCGQNCSPAATCETNMQCSVPLLMQESAATFRAFPPSVEDYREACREYQRFTNCRRQVDPSCLNTRVEQTCLAVQASVCATASRFESRVPGAFHKISKLPNRLRRAVRDAYEDCRGTALARINQKGLSPEQLMCRLGFIYYSFEQCRTNVYKTGKLFRELAVYYRYRYKESIKECQTATCTDLCSAVPDSFCQ